MAALLTSIVILRRVATATALAAAAALLVFFLAPFSPPSALSSFDNFNFVTNSNFISNFSAPSLLSDSPSPAPLPSMLSLRSTEPTNSTDTPSRVVDSSPGPMNSTTNTPSPVIAYTKHREERHKPFWSMTPQEQMVYVKKEIRRAPLVWTDPDLHAPLFRNLSIFKRSYELMERILKIYIYKEGQRPIFHTPILKGIYASEGWFMKLMEGNGMFVTKDPNRAHMFYLAYSAVRLEEALYVPNSHALRPLAIFLRNYVNMLASRYPFWNRTKGADHFIVACHDWGPYTTREHSEFHQHTIKAVCNADLSEGFIHGKDVSLPETSIRTPRWPIRDIGGKPISRRTIFAFYAGKDHGRVRPILRKFWDGKDEDIKVYGPLPRRVSKKMNYVQHMKSSKYCLCPMGYEVNSPRIVEAIYYECVPVIIADNFVLPFEEVLNWSAFSVVVAEKDIPNLKNILLAIPMKRYIEMQRNVQMLQKHFLWHTKPVKYDLFHMILHSVWFNRLNQIEI